MNFVKRTDKPVSVVDDSFVSRKKAQLKVMVLAERVGAPTWRKL